MEVAPGRIKSLAGEPGKTVPGTGPARDARGASLHIGAALGPGESVEDAPLAIVPGVGFGQEQDQVKVERNQAKVKVERNQDQNQKQDQVKV